MGVLINMFKGIEYHKSIDTLPIHSWFKINETNDLKWLLIGKHIELGKRDEALLFKMWEVMMDEFIDTFGIPEKMKEILELRRSIFVLKCQLILTGKKTLNTFIKIKQFQLEKLIAVENKTQTGSVKVYVEKYLGRHIDMKTISVKEFYEYLEAMNTELKTQKENVRK